jgi:Ca2+/Na+ antiporter
MNLEKLINEIEISTPNLLFQSIVIVVIITTLLNRFILPYQILFILLSFFISYLWVTYKNKNNRIDEYKNDIYLDKLNNIMNKGYSKHTSVLYKNPDLVYIFIKMCYISRFNNRNFKSALVATNQIITIYESVKIGNLLPNQTIDIVEELQKEILNNMQSILHSIPSTNNNFEIYLNTLQKILQKIVDDVKLIYEKEYEKNGPNIYNPPPSIRSGPWSNPIDSKEYNPSWNFY